jgi:glutaredoxin
MRRGRRYLIFYTRPQCHLCAQAAPRVRRAALLNGMALQEIDIDDHPELAVDYGLRIPVVEDPDGRVLAEGNISTPRLWVAILKRRWESIGGK